MGMYLITLTPFLLFLTGGFQVNQNAILVCCFEENWWTTTVWGLIVMVEKS